MTAYIFCPESGRLNRIFGTRQSGLPDLKLVQLTDVKLLELAREEAQIIFENDKSLEQPQHRLLARQVENFWKNKSDLS